MKKIISLFLFLVTVSVLFCVNAFAITSSLDGNVLTISGEGEIPVDAFRYRSDIQTVIIEEGITDIGDYAFYYCTNLQTVSLPNTLKKIGINAFLDCHALKTINIPNSVNTIHQGAFRDCYALSKIEIPSSVYVRAGAFLDCNNLTATLHRTAQTFIEESPFVNVPNLLVKIPIGWSGDRNSFGAKNVKYGSEFITKTVSSWSELKSTLEGLTDYQYIDVTCSEDWNMQESEDFIEITANNCTINFEDSHSIQSLSSKTGSYGVFFYINADNVTLNLNNKILRTGDSTTGDYVSAIVVNGDNCHIKNGRFYDCGEPGPADDKDEVWGAAIWVTKYDPGCVIENCIFEKCKSAYGGAIYTGSSGTVIKNCIFNKNSARIQGNDICDWSEDAVVENCRTTHGDSSCFLYAKETKNCEYNQSFESIWNGNNVKSDSVDDGCYIIRSALDPNYCLDISGGENAKSDGDNLHLWSVNSAKANIFEIKKDGNAYKIMATHSGKVLDIEGESTNEGATIYQWTDNSTHNQRWFFIKVPNIDNCYYIYSVQGGQTGWMDASGCVNGVMPGDDTNVQSWSYTGANNQMWILEKVDNNFTGSTISQGNIWIIAGIGIIAIGAMAIVVKKKKIIAE